MSPGSAQPAGCPTTSGVVRRGVACGEPWHLRRAPTRSRARGSWDLVAHEESRGEARASTAALSTPTRHHACVNKQRSLEFPEPFVDDLRRILRSQSASLAHRGQTSPFLGASWRLTNVRWQQDRRTVVELDVVNDRGDEVCVEVRAENFQRELGREEATDGSETPYEELVADLSSLVQELLMTHDRFESDRVELPPYSARHVCPSACATSGNVRVDEHPRRVWSRIIESIGSFRAEQIERSQPRIRANLCSVYGVAVYTSPFPRGWHRTGLDRAPRHHLGGASAARGRQKRAPP